MIEGVLFVNNSENPKAPDLKGSVTVDGKKQDIAVWKRQTKNGDRMYSFKIDTPYKQTSQAEGDTGSVLKDQDIPF
ncbi:hypothetical protein N9104_01660 [Pseudomonadales bacterium]|nr:hypothetical protein [Pseudomonadales bacterium]